MVTFVSPTLSDQSTLTIAYPSTGFFVVKYFLKSFSLLEAIVTMSPSGDLAALATKRSFAKFGVATGTATALATANGE